MLVHISDITVKKRIRKDVSGIDELADSIRKSRSDWQANFGVGLKF